MSAPSTLFIGTYTETPDPDADAVWPEVGTLRTAAEGISVASFDPAAGVLSAPSLAAEQEISPSWLRWHPELPVLYSTGETWDGSPSTLSSYALAPAGPLRVAEAAWCNSSARALARLVGLAGTQPATSAAAFFCSVSTLSSLRSGF